MFALQQLQQDRMCKMAQLPPTEFAQRLAYIFVGALCLRTRLLDMNTRSRAQHPQSNACSALRA